MQFANKKTVFLVTDDRKYQLCPVITNLVLRMMLFLICHSTVMLNASKHNHHIRLGLLQRKVT